MAAYKYGNLLIQEYGGEFDAIHSPGILTPYSGIYRCEACGASAVSTLGHPLPPQGHHPHANALLPIQWRLVVKTTHR